MPPTETDEQAFNVVQTFAKNLEANKSHFLLPAFQKSKVRKDFINRSLISSVQTLMKIALRLIRVAFFVLFGLQIIAAPLDDLRQKAEAGDAEAQYNLGRTYYLGNGVPKDLTEAVKWYSRAAEQGFAPAQVNLGNMYSRGEGAPKDDTKAVKWIRKAAD